MTKTATFFGVVAVAFAGLLLAGPANAQRAFVSGNGSDLNPCTFPQPCRTFQQAFNVAPAGAEIDVLDPAGYGPLNITHGISIQGHGFGGVTQTTDVAAITINANAGDDVTLNSLLLDGAGAGTTGIAVFAGGSVQILDCVVRHFSQGIEFFPQDSSVNLTVADTIVSDNLGFNGGGAGMLIDSSSAGSSIPVTLDGIIANNNVFGVVVFAGKVAITDSVMTNNTNYGLIVQDSHGSVWLAKSMISGNGDGVGISAGTINSYGDNDIDSNTTDVAGSLTPDVTR